jgi:membrane dipeptidase
MGRRRLQARHLRLKAQGVGLRAWTVVTLAAVVGCGPTTRAPATSAVPRTQANESAQAATLGVSPAALRLHRRALVLDTHIDTPQRLAFEEHFDLAARQPNGHVDIPRMREGGLDAAFFSVWFPGTVTGPPAVRRALDLIDEVREAVRANARDLTLATSAADIRRANADGKIAILLGMEGGHMIDDDLRILRNYAALGVRYLTLTHSRHTNWADSSGQTPATHGGLTPFGREVVLELNRLGIMVDVSHVADETFDDALAVSRAPMIASHSSCRAISNNARNMTDDMLRAIAAKGGVVMINYHATFLSEAFRTGALAAAVVEETQKINKSCGDDESCAILKVGDLNRSYMQSGVLPRVSWEVIVDHIDHAVKVAGIDHVGLGSDFDGATMPLGMDDVSKLPRLTDALLKRGYSEANVEKILGGNFLRVMARVEAIAHESETAR